MAPTDDAALHRRKLWAALGRNLRSRILAALGLIGSGRARDVEKSPARVVNLGRGLLSWNVNRPAGGRERDAPRSIKLMAAKNVAYRLKFIARGEMAHARARGFG